MIDIRMRVKGKEMVDGDGGDGGDEVVEVVEVVVIEGVVKK